MRVRAFGVYSVNALFTSCYEIISHNANIHVMKRRARRASPLQSLAEARLNTRKQVKDLRLRVRAFGVYSVNALFTSCYEIISHNANNTRHETAGEACLAPTKPCGNKAKHETDKHYFCTNTKE